MLFSLIKIFDQYIFFGLLKKIYKKITSSKRLKVYNTKTGKFYLPKYAYKDIIRNQIINNKKFDYEIFELSQKYIKENSIVLDAGANYGQLSILFSKIQKNIDVYSFESSKFIFEILKKNIEINKANCKPINCILGNEEKKIYNIKEINLKDFSTYGSNKVHFVNDKNIESNVEKVKTLKIDELKFNKNISFFKIDVQGFDLEVLKGSKKTIGFHKMPIIFEYEKLFENDFNYKFKDFENFIYEINYKIIKEINSNYLIVPK